MNRPASPPSGGYPRPAGAYRPGQGPNRGPNRGNQGRHVDQTRINERIRAPKVRVVDGQTAAQLGVLPTAQALRMARERGLDLVEVAANVDPPVCKIIDYGKYKYQQEKHKKEAHRHHKAGKVKELKFRIGIDPHDYHIKILHAEDFLAEGHKVRVQLQFRGRQIAHQELGHALAARIKEDLHTMGHCDQEPKMAGRNINLQISPLPGQQRHRKFKTHLKGITEPKDPHYQHGHDPREDRHDESHADSPADSHGEAHADSHAESHSGESAASANPPAQSAGPGEA